MAAFQHPVRRSARCAETTNAYAVRLPHALVHQLDAYLRWQRQHAASDAAAFRSRPEAVRWLLRWAIDALIRAHQDRLAAADLAALFSQPNPKTR